jgi:hypothetical protein
VLPFHDGNGASNNSNHLFITQPAGDQDGGPETELGIINGGCSGYAFETSICENRDNEINNRRASLNTDEENTFDRNMDGTKSEFKSLVPFCLVLGMGALFSQSISVYLSSQITVLERAFGLSSAKSGLLLSANDIGFVVTVLLASHFLKQ